MTALHEKHRPRCWDEVAGQGKAVASIRRVLARGWGGRAWWLDGDSGTGKTTLAYLIAGEGADEWGIEELDAQALTTARLREVEREMAGKVLSAKGGRAYVVNEAHGLRRDAIRLLLVMLERLPEHVAFVFTTTKAGQQSLFEDDCTGDAAPLLSRCIAVSLANDADSQSAMAARVKVIATAEDLDGLPNETYVAALSALKGNMRALFQRVEAGQIEEAATPPERSAASDDLDELGRRWEAGERIAQLAIEAMMTWNKLHSELTKRGFRERNGA